MEGARATWTDERLDDLSRRMDDGFRRVDKRFDRLADQFDVQTARIDALQRAVLQVGVTIVCALIVTQTSLILALL